MKAKQRVKRLLQRYGRKEKPILAITGDHANRVVVPNRTGYIFARLPNDDVVQVYNSIAPLTLDVDITIGFNPKDPNLLQVTSIVGARGIYGREGVQKVGPLSHHATHEWMSNQGATDVVFSELRQLMPFRPTPEGAMSLHVSRGVAWINDAWQHTSGSSMNFAPYVEDMVSGTAQYALAYLDANGVPDFIIGSGNLTTMAALSLDDIPDAYPGTVPIAAVKLRGNQTGIVEAKQYTDLIDLRFPFRHDHPFTDLDDVPHNYSGYAGKAVTVKDTEDGLEFTTMVTGGAAGDVTAAANIADNSVVRGDGGVKGVQESGVFINDSGVFVTGTWQGTPIQDGYIDFGTGSNQVSALDLPIADDGAHYTGTNVEVALQESGVNVDYMKNFFNGSFIESFNALVTSDGGTITMSLEQSGGGNLTMRFSDGFTPLDCTPALTIALTAGSDVSPQENFIYIPQSSKVLTKSISDWPVTEHIKVSYFLVPSAGFTQTNGVYVNQNWNDHRMDTSSMGHMAHMAERSRRMGAIYTSGIAGNGTDGYLTPTANNVELKSTAGVVFQMHRHTVSAFDTSTSGTVLVKNWNGDAYHDITNLFDITDDSGGNTITNNRYFNLVIWAVANKSGEYTPMMINLPSGFYNIQSSAENDTSGYDDFTIPSEYAINSSTGFLIARITIKMNTTWEVISTTDLRGTTPQSASGGGGGTATEFADNTFRIFDEGDSTKEIAFQASGISTSTTRTIDVPDADGLMVLEDNELAGQLIFKDSAVIPPFRVAEQSAEPSSPTAEDVYLDDGSNTASGNPGWRRYTGAVWEDISAGAGGGGNVATDSIWDQAGDLAVGTGSNSAIRLPVGTDTHVLTVDSGEPSGVKWAAQSGGGLSNSNISPTSGDQTAAVNTRYFADISGLDADRNFVLPAGAVGDKIVLNITTGDATYEYIVKGDTGITINGGAAATEWSRLFIDNESVTLVANTTSNWQVTEDGRIPCTGKLIRISSNGNTTHAAGGDITSDWNSAELDIGGIADTTNDRFNIRRTGLYEGHGGYAPAASIGTTKYYSVKLFNGATQVVTSSTRAYISSTVHTSLCSTVISLSVGDTFIHKFRTEEANIGLKQSDAGSNRQGASFFSIVEVL